MMRRMTVSFELINNYLTQTLGPDSHIGIAFKLHKEIENSIIFDQVSF